MKIQSSIVLAALINHSQAGHNLRKSADRRLLNNDDIDSIEFTTETGECSYDLLAAALADECSDCDLVALLGFRQEERARQKVARLCEDAIADKSNPRRGAFSFSEITDEGYQFDKEFFDGGTPLNAEYEPKAIVESKGGEYIEDIFETVAQEELITYPDYLEDNFLHNCEAQAVMCCWVQDRQANDNNGNCDDDDCYDKDPADNTDVCYVDLAAASKSNHVEGGFALFPGNTATTGEGDAHCHGFTWPDDVASPEYRYRGNVLFFVSMYDHLENRGYVRNVPGATMCSCIDKSPTVSRSDCTNAEVTETFIFSTIANNNGKKVLRDVTIESDITFNNCPTDDGQNNDLGRWYNQEIRSTPATTSDIVFDEHIVGDCEDGDHYEKFLEKKGYALK